jgi:excisionase family DNA binding protein
MSIREQAEKFIADPMMSPNECAKELGCTGRFIRAEIAEGRLKAIKISHKMIRVRRSWWNAYLAQRETKTNGQKT